MLVRIGYHLNLSKTEIVTFFVYFTSFIVNYYSLYSRKLDFMINQLHCNK